jgi:hypothetical protein
MGADGREHVRENFLITRYLRDYLAIFNTLAGNVELTKSPARLLSRAGR